MKILITGIDGFIGRRITARLLTMGHKLVGLSNGTFYGDGITFYKTDITDRSAVFDVVKKSNADLCIHLAAMAHADIAPGGEAQVRRINIDGAKNVIDAMAEPGDRRFIYFSTVKVLAERTDDQGIDEAIHATPMGIYARSKFEIEQYLQSDDIASRLKSVIVRPCPVIGPNDDKGNYAKMFHLVKAGFFPLVGGGQARRSIVFIDTLVDRIATMVTDDIVAGRTYVLCDGTFSVRQIVDAMRNATGYAFCPEIDDKQIERIGRFVDPLLSTVFNKPAPVTTTVKRLAESFVIRAHHFEEDYGKQPGIDLSKKMKWLYEEQHTGLNQLRVPRHLRYIDKLLAISGITVTGPIMALVYLAGLLDTGAPLFAQERVGKHKQPFTLYKFRTMKTDTKSVASHLASTSSITPLGKFLRKTKLDELPQLFNVLKGEMSIVGPRPNLYNQHELLEERDKRGVYDVLPGITGLAQISGIDMSTPAKLADVDKKMIMGLSLTSYFTYIIRTAIGGGSGDAVNSK